MDYSLIIPIYNEDKTLNSLLSQLKKFDNNIEIIIINDGSTDTTKSILEKQNNIIVFHNEINKGKGFSIIKGVGLSSRNNIILMDGDLEIDLKSIHNLIKEFEKHNDQVITGKRWNEESNAGLGINTYGNHLINYLFNFLYDTKLTDVLCCVKIIKKDLLESIQLKSIGFNIEMEIMSKLVIRNINIREKNVIYNRRSNEKGKKLKLSDGWGIVYEMFKNKFNNFKL